MLKPLKRHHEPCKRREWDQGYTRCGCPVWIRGTLRGTRGTVSASKYLPETDFRDLERGRDLAVLWERTGEISRPEEYAPIAATPEPEPEKPRVDAAISAYLKAAT